MTGEEPTRRSGTTINLSLISHTNAGKTTLARTLLGRDIGEVRDAAHVTDLASGHVLVQSGEDSLMLWDTPGFGDTARLLSRLRMSGNPIGWFLSQVWDRWRERPFWSSQQAIKNAREQADVILYLVNAAEDPASASYVALEMDVLDWIAKPVVVLLNQMGAPREDVSGEIARWSGIGAEGLVRATLPLDAFARCWVQEIALLDTVAGLLPPAKAGAMTDLARKWQEINRNRFEASMAVLVVYLHRAARDRETVEEADWQGKVANTITGRSKSDRFARKAMTQLAARLSESTAKSTDELIQLHGLSGKAARKVLERVSNDYAQQAKTPEGAAGALGGIFSGAVGGLAADIAAGGLTLGGGMIIGAILGALGGTGIARGFNLARGEDNANVRWSAELLERLTVTALLRYLAVAHFGRGRGEWAESANPMFWQPIVEEAVTARKADLSRILQGSPSSQTERGQSDDLSSLLQDIGLAILARLYPGSQQAAIRRRMADPSDHQTLSGPSLASAAQAPEDR